MSMKKFFLLSLLVMTVLYCTGCGAAQKNEPVASDPVEEEQPVATVSEPESSNQGQDEPMEAIPVPPEKIMLDGQPVTYDKFPVPTADTFSISEEYADLYNAAVSLYNNQTNAASFSEGNTDLVMVALRLRDQYIDDDGNTVYIVNFMQRDFYDLGRGLADAENPVYNYGSGGTLAALTLDQDGNLVDFDEAHDGEDENIAYRRICGPLTDLADFLCGKTDSYPVEPVDIPDLEPEDMVRQYLNYFFTSST